MKKSKIKPIKVTQKELAEYLQVNSSAITHYKSNPVGKRKVFLMLKGLQKIKEDMSKKKKKRRNKMDNMSLLKYLDLQAIKETTEEKK